MSQFPPPPQYPPGPPQFPPAGPPQFVQSVGYGNLPAPSQSNPAAIASLVLGILGCIPFLTGILAVIFGMFGIRAARRPNGTGSGLAITGIILGVLSLLGWGGVSALSGWLYMETQPARVSGRQFISDLSTGNIAGAQSASAAGMPPANLKTSSDEMQKWGGLTDMTFASVNSQSNMGQPTTVALTGTATFAIGTKSVTLNMVKEGGIYKVQYYHIK